ncbi:hypothetical protein HYPSUDRAFT_72763 [Hypholoma sublateritium FD-334 SS-4]|uniref:Uncharacterized protein n=1 Tax=Hypholoma sublateritium (strain FD-334 SS-4) TaxID=945553 RepID=A0A0D2P030_HYPSF|nr:hypothetical protein HYPSUDRAFT_72763 [Hypholoma sublateritium FD-334 SS-4]
MTADQDSKTVTRLAQDRRYRELLEQRTNIDLTLRVLAYTILAENEYIPNIEEFLDLPCNSVINALAGLAPIVVCGTNKTIHFVDDAFPDFLLDETRSAKFYIDWGVWHAKFSHHYFERMKTGAYGTHELSLITFHLQNINSSQQLHEDILSFAYTLDQLSYLSHAYEGLWDEVSDFLTAVKGLKFDDNDEAYSLQRDRMASLLARDFKAFRGQLISLVANHNIHLRVQPMNVDRSSRKKRAERVFWNKTKTRPMPKTVMPSGPCGMLIQRRGKYLQERARQHHN